MPLGDRIEAIELTFTIAPLPCFSMTGSTCLAVRKKLFTLTSNTRCHSSSLSSTGPPVEPMPTLLSSTSMRPHLARQVSTIDLTLSFLEASDSKATASPPSLAMSPTVSSAAARLRSTQNTLAPSRAKVTAVHLPLPQPGPLEPAPTTIATLSANLPGMSMPPFLASGSVGSGSTRTMRCMDLLDGTMPLLALQRGTVVQHPSRHHDDHTGGAGKGVVRTPFP